MESMIFWDSECFGRFGSRQPSLVSKDTRATAVGKNVRIKLCGFWHTYIPRPICRFLKENFLVARCCGLGILPFCKK